MGLVKLSIAWQDVRLDELHQIKTCSILQHDDKDRKKLPNIKEKRGFFTFFAKNMEEDVHGLPNNVDVSFRKKRGDA